MEFGVDNDREFAHFLAQLHVESAGFKRVVESLNYSVEGLRKTFNRSRISDEDCLRYGRKKGRKANQIMIAVKVYGGAWGETHLGNKFQLDGWNFRGHGLIQLTGRANFEECSRGLFGDLRLIDDPHYLATPEGAARSAGWFWHTRGCRPYAIRDDLVGVRRRINPALLGLEHAEMALKQAKKLLEIP